MIEAARRFFLFRGGASGRGPATVGGWRLAVGGWRLAVGGWRLAVGGWRLAVGGWQARVCRSPVAGRQFGRSGMPSVPPA
ncbi:annexin Max4 [Burkholderia pseudomallei]|nr:annexin Max4 [Burkholderia pseudomallei]